MATHGNLNNELGVPLTVLRATADTAYLVVEMGARHEGNIAYLCTIARPRVAAVLNVGSAHLGEFGSREAIARTKGEIVEALPADGTAVLPGWPDPWLDGAGRPHHRPGARPSAGRRADVFADRAEDDDLMRMSFLLAHDGGDAAPVRLHQVGAHQMINATAAAAMAARGRRARSPRWRPP